MFRPAKALASRLTRRTKAIKTSAAPHACSCKAGSACSAELKMNSGIEARAWLGLRVDLVANQRRGEEQRSGLAGDPRRRERRTRHDPAHGLRQDHAQGRPPLGGSECEARFPQRVRNEREHFLGRPRDQRQHQDRERKARFQPALPVPDDEEDEDEDPDHDRGDPVQHVEREGEHVREPLRSELVEIDRRQDSDRECHQNGEADDDRAAHDGIRDARRHRLAEAGVQGLGLREEVDADRARAALRDRRDDDHEHGNGEQRRAGRGCLDEPVHDSAATDPLGPEEVAHLRSAAHETRCRPATRRTMIWARTFATSENTSRITAR